MAQKYDDHRALARHVRPSLLLLEQTKFLRQRYELFFQSGELLLSLLFHGAGVSTAQIHFDAIQRRVAVRIFRLDPAHPLRSRVANVRKADRSGLATLASSLLAPLEAADSLSLPPWYEPTIDCPLPP